MTRMALPFERQCQLAGWPIPQSEYRFCPSRRWRADFGWPKERLLLEVDGAVFTQGRHTRGAGWLKDQEKLNTAAILGFRVLHVTPQQIADGSALTWITKYFLDKSDAKD